MIISIIDGYSTSRFLVKELRQRGVECIHVRSQQIPPAAYLRSFDASDYTRDLGWSADLEETVTALKGLGVERVIAGTESGVRLADILNHQLDLPGNRIELIDARRDKAAMACALREAGLDAAEDFLTDTPEDAVTWFRSRQQQAVVVKPPASAGTDNVRVCTAASEVAEACRAVLDTPDFFGNPNRLALLQEFLDGEEYYVNTVSRGGVHKVAEIWQSGKTPGPGGAPLYDFHVPVSMSEPIADTMCAYIKKVLTALGIENGAGHSELRLTDRGPVLIETGARLGGAALPQVALGFAGISHVRLLVMSLTDPEAFDAFKESGVAWSRTVRWVSLISHHEGIAGSGAWKNRFARLETYHGLVSKIGPGKLVTRTTDLASAPGFVYLVSRNAEAVEQDYARIRVLETDGLYLT